MCDLVVGQLLERFEIQCQKLVRNYPFLMGQGIWLDSDKLTPNDSVRDVLKHGSLTIGFIGLAECLVVLTGKHHGESETSQKLGLEIVGYMRKKMNEATEKYKLNFGVIGTPAEGLSGRFVRIDKSVSELFRVLQTESIIQTLSMYLFITISPHLIKLRLKHLITILQTAVTSHILSLTVTRHRILTHLRLLSVV